MITVRFSKLEIFDGDRKKYLNAVKEILSDPMLLQYLR